MVITKVAFSQFPNHLTPMSHPIQAIRPERPENVSRLSQPSPIYRKQGSRLNAFQLLQRAAVTALILLRLISSEAHADITSNLRAHYPFTAGTGSDVSGNALTATLSNITVTPGPLGISADAALFNGTSSSAVVGATIAMTNQQTYAAWIKPSALATLRPIIAKAVPGDGGAVDCLLLLGADGKIQWYVNTEDGGTGMYSYLESYASVPLNTWTHVAGVIDRPQNQIQLYINGILNGTAPMGERNVRNRNRTVGIGMRSDNQPVGVFQGAIDEVRIYDRSLSNSEIQAVMTDSSGPQNPSVYDLDLDRIPDAWENQYGLNAGIENFKVGSSVDGNLTVNAGQTTYVNDTAIVISSTQIAGSAELTGVIPVTTRIGDVFMLHVTQNGNPATGAPAGTFEFVQISSIQDGKVGLKSPLKSTCNPTTGGKIQCIHVPQYDSLLVNGTVAARPWNGTNGGIVAIIANDVTISSGGRIDASGTGFRSGAGFSVYGSFNGVIGTPGEGNVASAWPLPNSTTANSGGGAGGNFGSVGGGGTVSETSYFGFGGGGGSGGVGPTRIASIYGPSYDSLFTSTSGSGGKGGGLVVIISRSLQNSGVITSAGAGGQAGAASGGGGAGGSMLLISRINGTGTVSAQQGASGAYPSTTGAGADGKIRLERGSVSSTPIATTTGDGYFDNQTFAALVAYADTDGDGLDDYGEYLADTSPILPDTDGDGVPDGWEVRFGTPPKTADANADPDQDGLTNLQEYRAGSSPTSKDGDNDGIPDTAEINIYGTNPLLADTDGDGMDDNWEIANGLNPLLDDASDDRDLDGLTNLEEYGQRAAGYKANAANSKAGQPGDDGLNDYLRLKGEGWTHRLYDKNDRLISTERDNGTVQLYTYDGNSQKIRDIALSKIDADGDGLPDGWELAHGLAFTGASAALGDNGPLGDPDHDGFTNLAEWKTGTDPHDAQSHPNALAAVNLASASANGFTGASWSMAVGQASGYGPDEIIVATDGTPGTGTNSLQLLSKDSGNWVSSLHPVGLNGVTSVQFGPPASGAGNTLAISTRISSSSGSVKEMAFSPSGITERNLLFSSTTSLPHILGINEDTGLVFSGAAAADMPDSVYTLKPSAGSAWGTPGLVSSTSGGLPSGTITSNGMARWLGGGKIEYPAPRVIPSGAINRTGTNMWYYLTPSAMTWPDAENTAISNGGHLATIPDQDTQDWVRFHFDYDPYWIGLRMTGGTLVWASGAPFFYTGPREMPLGATDGYFGYRGSPDPYSQRYWQMQFEPLRGIGEVAAGIRLFQADVANGTATLLKERNAMRYGRFRPTAIDSSSLFIAYVADRDSSSGPTPGDDFVIKELVPSSTQPSVRGSIVIPISASAATCSYAMAIVGRNSSKPRLFVCEPDGTISILTPRDANASLARTIFSTEYKGKAWEQLEPLKEADGEEGLVGLLVDPATPAQCQVIYWSSESIKAALNDTAPVLNHRPSARVLPSPSGGGVTGLVGIRIWDVEAHGSSLELQYQRDGETTWNVATVSTVDGATFQPSLKLATQPGGVSHTLVWNAAANLGSAFSGTVLLRTRATDSQTSDWSPAMPYTVNTSINLDTDGDGMPDAWEDSHGLASANPTDGTSDYDHDGVSAFLEYALAMNPTVTDVALLPILGTKTEADGKHLTLTFRRPVNSGLTYTAERSVTLSPGNWQSGNAVFQELTPLNLGDGTESVTVEDLSPMSSSTRAWLRLRVSK